MATSPFLCMAPQHVLSMKRLLIMLMYRSEVTMTVCPSSSSKQSEPKVPYSTIAHPDPPAIEGLKGEHQTRNQKNFG